MATAKNTTKRAPAKKAAPRAKKAPAIEVGKGEAVIYTRDGKTSGTITLPAALFGAKWNGDLVHQVVLSMEANARETTAHTKFRGEVRGGGKKPWKQKGTGRARHGSTRSPIWVGGGTTHGPRAERDYSVKINRKQKSAALASILSKKLSDGEVIFVESLGFSAPKTADAKKALSAIAKASGAEGLTVKKKNAAVIAFASKDESSEKSFRNIGNVITEEIRNLNPVDLVMKKYLVIERPEESLKVLSSRITKKA
jgi:large subunit ribosomal protein L4